MSMILALAFFSIEEGHRHRFCRSSGATPRPPEAELLLYQVDKGARGEIKSAIHIVAPLQIEQGNHREKDHHRQDVIAGGDEDPCGHRRINPEPVQHDRDRRADPHRDHHNGQQC